MEDEIKELQQYLQRIAEFSLPRFRELPSVDLYMEQVLCFINDALKDLSPDGEKMLTSFMVNNYVKAKMIGEPNRKKYSREQIGYLMAICLCKSTLSMGDMSLLIELDEGISSSKERVYAFWSNMEQSILSNAAAITAGRVNDVALRYENEKKKKDKQAAETNARDSLGLIALRLAIQAQADKLLSDYIIGLLRKDMHGEDIAKAAANLSPKETKHEIRQGMHEAERVAAIKERENQIAKKIKEDEEAKKKEASQKRHAKRERKTEK